MNDEQKTIWKEEIVTYCFFFLWLYSPIPTFAASMKLSVSLQLLDIGQPV
jgi:hypothetical protein